MTAEPGSGITAYCAGGDDDKANAAAYRERAQEVLWIVNMVTRDDARKILFEIAAEYQARALQLEEIIKAEETGKRVAKSSECADKSGSG